MLAAHELNDRTSPRIDHYLDKLQSIKTPNPETNDWQEWKAVLADRSCHIKNDPRTAMNINTDDGFGTVSSSLIALPKSTDFNPVWLFCSGAPDENEFLPIYF
jgi:hypothetical protein